MTSIAIALAGAESACSSPKREFRTRPLLDYGDSGSPGSSGSHGDGDASMSMGGGESASGGATGESGATGGAGNDGAAGKDGAGSQDGDGSAGVTGNAGSASSPACVTVDDCEGKDSDCAQRTCHGGTCGVTYAKSGVVVSAQTVGDCHRTICDGAGAPKTVVDDTDVPNDGNVCTKDVCTNGVRSNPNQPTTTPCGANSQFKCDGLGSCASCSADADCGQNNLCATFKCTAGGCKTTFLQTDPGQVPGDCKKSICNNGSLTAIVDNGDLPNDGKVCTKDLCTNGAPSNPPLSVNTPCAPSSTCDTSGNCVCGDPNACVGKCGSFNDACGHPVNCGGCTAPQSCGGGGTPFVCGCTPKPVCFDNCGGTVGNGCGGTFVCPALNECTCNQGCTPVCGGDICQCAGFCG